MKKKIAYLLLLLMLIPVGSFAKEKKNRLMEKAVSPFSVDETMRRIEEIIKSRSLKDVILCLIF